MVPLIESLMEEKNYINKHNITVISNESLYNLPSRCHCKYFSHYSILILFLLNFTNIFLDHMVGYLIDMIQTMQV